jgi:hypothetical protein
MLRDIWNNWVQEYRNNKWLFILEITGTIFSIVSSIYLSIQGDRAIMVHLFGLYLLGSISLVIVNLYRRSGFMFLLMLFYSIINIVGIINALRS